MDLVLGLILLWTMKQKIFHSTWRMKDSTTATQLKLLGQKSLEEIMELAKQSYAVQILTEFKREDVILLAVNKATAVSCKKPTK